MRIHRQRRSVRGFSLAMVMVFTGLSLMLLTGLLLWSSTTGRMTARYNEYYGSMRAAEAATEKIIAHVASDFQQSGFGGVNGNLGNYRAMVPTSAENGVSINYAFDDPTGTANQTYVAAISSGWGDVKWKYTGFQSSNAIYRIVSNTINSDTGNNIVGAVKQDVQIASLPLFEFGAFYAMDMEVNPGVNFQVGGRVHCNGTIYCEPSANVTFTDHVTASQKIVHDAHPQDSTVRTFGSVTYQGEHDGGATSLNLPLGVPNTSANLHKLIEIPPGGESPTSPMGLQRFYNKADLIIKVYTNSIWAGTYDNAVVLSSAQLGTVSNFMVTDIQFTDRRESVLNQTSQIDLGRFDERQGQLSSYLGHNVKILYVADLRPTGATRPAVRLVNGRMLTNSIDGLTIVTPNPLYVWGHLNAPDLTPGSTNTAGSKPVALIADSITFLSGNWDDTQSNSGLGSRKAVDTSVNAAIMAGIVQSTNGLYSGGLENYFRLLEDWTGNTLTFNGSMVVLYESQTPPRASWDGSGAVVYKRPTTRAFHFDNNFKNPAKLPPGTPEARTLIRADWAIVQPNSTQ